MSALKVLRLLFLLVNLCLVKSLPLAEIAVSFTKSLDPSENSVYNNDDEFVELVNAGGDGKIQTDEAFKVSRK